MKTQKRDGMLVSHPFFDTGHNYDDKVVSCTLRTHFIAKVLLNANRRDRSLENFQGSHRESKPELPHCGAVLQPTAGRGGGWVSMHKKLRFEELLKNCSLISGKGRNNSVPHCLTVSPGHHQTSTSFSGLRSGKKGEKHETEQLVSSSLGPGSV